MADETVNNGEFSDAVEITEDEDSPKILGLTQKISDLEQENVKVLRLNEEYRQKFEELKASFKELSNENVKVLRENEEYRQKIEELKASFKELSNENEEWKNQLEKVESENRTLTVVRAQAAELEAEVSRLQHDLVLAMSDLQESSAELSDLMRELEGVKEREKEKDVKLEAIGKERDLLLAKVEKLEEVERSSRDELEGKEIRTLKKNIEELEVVVESNKVLQKLKNELEKTIENMKGKISTLESSLDEKQKVISGFEVKERAFEESVNGDLSDDALVDGEKKGFIGGLKQKDWVVIGGSTISAIAVMGVACYIHAAKKH